MASASNGLSAAIALLLASAIAIHGTFVFEASAREPTPGYPEPIVQWGVQEGETCDEIAKAVYGSAKHVALILRYNGVSCAPGTRLPAGTTLVLPAEVTALPHARIRAMRPSVRVHAPRAAWSPAAPGTPLDTGATVNTLDEGQADIEFVDRARVFLSPNTLVVVRDTGDRFRVTKAASSVELHAGEVRAALAALRGQTVDVFPRGGGRVSAASRDTVVRRSGERTTIAVYDGEAHVSSGGLRVVVPEAYGTRFVAGRPPAAPRPLPPPPAWDDGESTSPLIALAPAGLGALSASWKPAPQAAGYRVELARDPEFNDVLAREDVKPDIVSFRAEEMTAGTYFLRVQTADQEEYLGVGAVRKHHLVAARASESVAVSAREITANPYGVVELTPSPALELAIDGGPFGPIPDRIDLVQRAPRELRLRERGASGAGAEVVIPIRYTAVSAAIQASRAADGRSLEARVELSGLAGIDVPARVAPALRAHLPGGVRPVALAAGSGSALSAQIPLPREAQASSEPLRVRLDVVDRRGAVLATRHVDLLPVAAPAAPAPHRAASPAAVQAAPVLGAYLPFLPGSAVADALWLSPTPPAVAAVGALASRSDGGWVAAGQLRASGGVGPLGLDLALRSNAAGAGEGAGSTGWLGARYRALRLGRSALELGPTLRVGVPLSSAGPPARVEPGLALGGAADRFTWVANAGARFRPARREGERGAPAASRAQAFLLMGGAADAAPWLRLHGALDLHLVHWDRGEDDLLGALSAGAEAGGALFGALSMRVSPWRDASEGVVTAQIAVGVRETPP